MEGTEERLFVLLFMCAGVEEEAEGDGRRHCSLTSNTSNRFAVVQTTGIQWLAFGGR